MMGARPPMPPMTMPIPPILRKILLIPAILVASAAAASAAAVESAPDSLPGYWHDSRAIVVRSGTGLCWRSGNWTPALAMLGCDGVLQPPIAKITAPPLMVVVPPAEPPAPPMPPARCDLVLALAGDDTFGFDETRLRPAAAAAIEQKLIAPLSGCVIERIVVRGYADRLGEASYNQRLSERRAEIVTAFLTSKGIEADFETHGLGATEQVTTCPDKLSLSALIACLAPDRRVTIAAFAVRRN